MGEARPTERPATECSSQPHPKSPIPPPLTLQVPDEWEEEEAIEHIADLFRRPALSEDAWLLLPAQPAP